MDNQVIPTYELSFGELLEDSDLERQVTAEAVLAAMDHAEQIRIPIDIDELAEEYPTLVDRIQDSFTEQSNNNGYPEFISRTKNEGIIEIVDTLLTIPTWHRVVSIGTVRLFQDQTAFVEYNADHRFFRVDSTVDTNIVETIREALADYDAGLLPAEMLAEWEQNNAVYRIDPPSLCVAQSGSLTSSETCLKLSNIDKVIADDEAQRIELDWKSKNGGRLVRAVAKALRALGDDPPETFVFEDPGTYEDVKKAFQTVIEPVSTELEYMSGTSDMD